MNLLGHDDAWRQWRAATDGPRMHHAWLLAGKKGLGKMHFALEAAHALVGSGPVPETSHHPDVIVLTHGPKDDKEEKKQADGKPFELARSIRIAQIRLMQRRLTTRPTMGEKRVVIIDPADDLERNAANALLKSLEEPPAGTFFLLISHRPARLLPTIRSRCRLLRFPDLTDEQVELALKRKAPEAQGNAVAAAVAAARGSPGAALEFVEHDLGPLFELMQRLVAEGDRDFGLRGRLTEVVGPRPDREALQGIFDLARAILAARLEQSDRSSQAAIVRAHEELVRLAGQAPTYNFDAGLLVTQIGGLLASAAPASERANV